MTEAFDQIQCELIVENANERLAAGSRSGQKGGEPRAKDVRKVSFAEASLRDAANYRSLMSYGAGRSTRYFMAVWAEDRGLL